MNRSVGVTESLGEGGGWVDTMEGQVIFLKQGGGAGPIHLQGVIAVPGASDLRPLTQAAVPCATWEPVPLSSGAAYFCKAQAQTHAGQ